MQYNAMPTTGGLLKTADSFLQAHCPAGDLGILLSLVFTLYRPSLLVKLCGLFVLKKKTNLPQRKPRPQTLEPACDHRF